MAKKKPATDRLALARERFSYAKQAWDEIREQFNLDLKMVTGDQWDPKVKAAREASGRPCLTDNRLHTEVQQVSNRARQDRPQPKISASDEGKPETAEALEGHLRHIQYASQADVAYDCAVEYSASGGIGYFQICAERVNDYRDGDDTPEALAKLFEQEPRIRRILDPMVVYFDPDCQEPDFSDANWCFVRKKMTHEAYEKEYGGSVDAKDFDDESLREWGDKEHIYIAQYWEVTTKYRELYQLADGTGAAWQDELHGRKTVGECYKVPERKVTCTYIDGQRELKDAQDWLGCWIPIIPVLGKEVIVEGKRQLISLVRNARGQSKLLNTCLSSIAETLGLTTRAQWAGYVGQFKAPCWDDQNQKNYSRLEFTTVQGPDGAVLPPPQRIEYEPPIEALTKTYAQQGEAIKASFGYIDLANRPSMAPISGVAVMRRDQQQDLTNFHFEDNLIRAQWHATRVIIDLVTKLVDTPRILATRAHDGTAGKIAVAAKDESGEHQYLPNVPPEQHHKLDVGTYDYTVSSGPSYATKQAEEADVIEAVFKTDPQVFTAFADLLFKIRGYKDLEERAKLLLPPAVQQAMAAKQQQIPPQVQAQLAQLMAERQQMQQAITQLIQLLKTKQIEAQGKLEVEKLKAAAHITVESMKGERDVHAQVADHRHEAALAMFEANQKAIEQLTNMLHESELGATPGPGMGNNAEPEPAAGPQGAKAA